MELARRGEGQLAADALLDEGERVVTILAYRSDSLVRLPPQAILLPDGRAVAPVFEGALVQAVLEAITGQRFRGPSEELVRPTEVLEGAEAWAFLARSLTVGRPKVQRSRFSSRPISAPTASAAAFPS
ncbi:MAG: hypothetical protein HC923_09865 [Myxococcales bacterium]|nr:hypothetical protein [Myxococcales bacterium]